MGEARGLEKNFAHWPIAGVDGSWVGPGGQCGARALTAPFHPSGFSAPHTLLTSSCSVQAKHETGISRHPGTRFHFLSILPLSATRLLTVLGIAGKQPKVKQSDSRGTTGLSNCQHHLELAGSPSPTCRPGHGDPRTRPLGSGVTWSPSAMHSTAVVTTGAQLPRPGAQQVWPRVHPDRPPVCPVPSAGFLHTTRPIFGVSQL